MSDIYRDIHFEGCRCDECRPFSDWEAERVRQAISREDLFGDTDSFDFEREASILIQNRRNEAMERDESAPSADELRALFQVP